MKSSVSLTETSAADTRLTLTDANGTRLAKVDLWWKNTPIFEGNPIGAIGGFEALNRTSSCQILDAACAHLKSIGLPIAVGPMDQNTWKNHRFVIESKGRPPFLLEPHNDPNHPDWWIDAGFTILSNYSSSIIVLDGSQTVSPAMKQRILSSGIRIENLDLGKFDDELRAIHSLSLESFANNFLYTPLDLNDFMAAYQKVRPHIDPEFVKLARRDDELLGFVFGIADLTALERNEKPALIVKTLAVAPHSNTAGLGSILVDELHLVGKRKGFTEAIHALQHETNTSRKITGRQNGTPFRRYALFSKNL